MWEAKVTFKGQVTIPKAVRTALSIQDGDSVLFTIDRHFERVAGLTRLTPG